MKETGTLYIVATPIGNLLDLSFRAKEILSTVDVIACEDTRVTAKLLARFEIEKKLVSIHQHTEDLDLKKIIAEIQNGKDIAYVSDAGTPGISDPGGRFVQLAVKEGVNIVTIPGASAVMAALQVSGLPADEFIFLGFPPHKKGRKTFFESLNDMERTVVFFESKHRIEKALQAVPQDRYMIVGRELTKVHECIYRGVATEIIEQINKTSAKGEFVLVLSPKNWKN